ncbi:MAG: hypothetical protein EZS28_025675, partial [Streblomastix strix]
MLDESIAEARIFDKNEVIHQLIQLHELENDEDAFEQIPSTEDAQTRLALAIFKTKTRMKPPKRN